MKRFILEIPEDQGVTLCGECPWIDNRNICQYCDENNLCRKYNFAKANLSEE